MARNFNLIDDRISNIKTIVTGKSIDPITDFKDYSEIEYEIEKTDIRELLPKKYINFEKAIHELGAKLVYVKSGSTGHTFKGIYPNDMNGNKEPFAIKVVAYPKKENYGDLYNAKRPENAELLMIKLLSFFVINKQTTHIILPLATFNTSIKPFLNLTKDKIIENKKYEQFIEKYNKGDYYMNVSILISEWANGGDLLDYLRKNYKNLTLREWQTIFFQIFSVLAVIHAKYPGFRHNDMKANNILIYKVDIDELNNKNMYRINGQKYSVPIIGVQIKLWDFDFACIKGVVNNAKVDAEWTNKINISSEQNRYYDIHYFFNTLIKKGFLPEFHTSDVIPNEVKEFVLRILPPKYQNGDLVSERGRILVNDEYTIPDTILKNDPFFKKFRRYN